DSQEPGEGARRGSGEPPHITCLGRLLKKAFSLPLAHARGSVSASESARAFLNRDPASPLGVPACEGAARSLSSLEESGFLPSGYGSASTRAFRFATPAVYRESE